MVKADNYIKEIIIDQVKKNCRNKPKQYQDWCQRLYTRLPAQYTPSHNIIYPQVDTRFQYDTAKFPEVQVW